MTTTPPAPTLTAATDADPCPRVEVLITPMPVDVDEVTVYRSWKGQRQVVRGASRAEVAGDYLIIDYEVPLGVPVSYTSVGFDVSGVPSQESASTTVTVDVADVWLQDPLDPTTALAARMSRTSVTEGVEIIGDSILPASYQATTTVQPVVGSALPVGMASVRRAVSRAPLTFIAWSPTDAETLRTLLMQTFPLCVRTPAAIPQLGGLTYFALPDFVEAPYPGWTATLFTASGDAVRPPGSGIVIQPRTYADLSAEAATYAGLLALYPTYVDVKRGL